MALDNFFVVKKGLTVNGPSELADNLSVSGSLDLYNDINREQWRAELDVSSGPQVNQEFYDTNIYNANTYLTIANFDAISGTYLRVEHDPVFAALSGQFILKDVSGMALTELMVFSATVGYDVDADYTSITDALNYFQASFFSYAIIDIIGPVSLSGNNVAITKPIIFQGRYNEVLGQGADFAFDGGQLQINNLSIEFKDINLTSNGNENIILGNDSVDKVSNLYLRNSNITLSDYDFIKIKVGSSSTHKIIVDNSSILYSNIVTPSAYFLQISGNPTVSTTTDLIFTNTSCSSSFASIIDSHSSNPTNVYCFNNTNISGSVNQSNGVVNVYIDASSNINATTKTLLDTGSRVLFTPNGTNSLVSTNVTNAINELGNTVSNLNSSLSGSYIQKVPSLSASNLIQPTDASFIPLTIKGASSQTANLTEWKNSSGTVLASISADGSITLANLSGINGNIVIHDANGKLLDSGLLASSLSNGVVTLYPDSSTRNVIVPTSSSIIPITISGAANQTANLTEWKNNTGTILACIDASGGFSSLGAQYVNINTIATSGTNTIGTAIDYLMVFTGILDQTYTLPSCTNGRNIIVKNKSTGIITISGNATIDDGSSWVLYGGDAVTLIGNSTTNWEVV